MGIGETNRIASVRQAYRGGVFKKSPKRYLTKIVILLEWLLFILTDRL